MELCYIWMEAYRDGYIRDQGFIFDPRYRYALKVEEGERFVLQVKANPYEMDGFFRVETEPGTAEVEVRQVTAIVGENGAGKSTLLDYIKECIVDREQLRAEATAHRFVYVFRHAEGEESSHVVYCHPRMSLDVRTAKGTVFSHTPPAGLGVGSVPGLESTRFLFLSNIFDGKREPAGFNLLNVSTNYLSDEKRRHEAAPVPREGSRHRFYDVKRQILFASFVGSQRLPFDTPRQLQVYLNKSAYWSRLNEPRYRDFPLSTSIINVSAGWVKQRNAAAKQEPDSSLLYLLRFMLEHLVDECYASPVFDKLLDITVPPRPVAAGGPKSISALDWLADFEHLIVELGVTMRSFYYQDTLDLTERFNPLLELTRWMYKLFIDSPLKFDDNQTPYLILDLDQMGTEGIRRFLQLCEAVSGEHEIVRFMWRDLSSGQKALFNVYSRLYFAAGFMKDDPVHDVVLLIDEGDIYMHPHWQQLYIDNLLQTLPHLFDSQPRRLQLILTSNSPFVVSDLPNTSVIYLKKDGGGCRVMDSLEDQPQTFAANIHTLLAHSFFMQEGMVGAFAKRKINEAVHLLIHESSQEVFARRKQLETLLSLIGEPLIRDKISQMLKDKLAVRMFGVDQEIVALKERIDELERWKRDQNRAD